MSSAEVAALITSAEHLLAAKYYALASFAMMFYDILLTLDREVEKIWKKKFSGLTVLWFLNRWVFFMAVIPTIASFHDPHFVGALCERYFRYPGYVATFQRIVVGSVFILRTYCIYGRSLKVASLIGVFLLAEVIVKLYATFAWGTAIQLPEGFVACVLTTSEENASKFIVFWVTELATDGVVLFLTIYRSVLAFNAARGFAHTRLWRVIAKDGLMYFFVMFAANLTTVLMYITASEDLKAVNADFGVMINSLMTARLILNLKAAASNDANDTSTRPYLASGFSGAHHTWEANILGNIGNEFEGGSSFGTNSYSSSMTIRTLPTHHTFKSGMSPPSSSVPFIASNGQIKSVNFESQMDEYELPTRNPDSRQSFMQLGR